MKDILVTGGAGFIGSHFIEYLLQTTELRVTNVDVLTYAGNLRNLDFELPDHRYRFFQEDIHQMSEEVFDRTYDCIVNFAAETHVDRSIEEAEPFLHTNILGTFQLIQKVMEGKARKLLQVSTDEVYGSLDEGEAAFTESHPLMANNPYSASKASADLLVRSYFQTYKLPLLITRCSNNYGPKQHPEKLIPKTIEKAMRNEAIPIYGEGKNIRDWLYVEDHCRAIYSVMQAGQPGEVYNIGGHCEKSNLEIVNMILEYLGKSKTLITFVPDRLGHDFHYAMNWTKVHEALGWEPRVSFEEGIAKTIEWTLEKTMNRN
ncbi:dTDP-glucose 4,6-dehydratase [Pullulanibacillus pueri]|uniref:dTDP-glucose 4,6-dehydratase n=1 Tax=Pullulanibacillus pueri TaxID=1437324 RepID=A0A8J2ZRK1_9BACL|nr:dTDP-glucose 4,6-dehydratase [Pullulanibacillus pueri]MBM7680005.1 dTDP-glucose 4,6-dehydratase [Pullulanibacillus pueri]GGH73896.1 dTDP-glucose 4,6-dehydratase [Pullulanibacillus pueri]